jgi:PAS domain S-box-containing protein
LSFATDADDFEKNFSRLFDDRMKEQLEYSKVQFDKYRDVQKKSIQLDTKPLPRTMEDALRQTSRAIVITEPTKPFRVWDVNQTWENLCGYSFVESKGKTLGSLLRGDDTDQLATTAMISRLLSGEEAGATLTNYTKSGRRFRNRVRIGPIFDETERVTHFVGVLQEIHDGY